MVSAGLGWCVYVMDTVVELLPKLLPLCLLAPHPVFQPTDFALTSFLFITGVNGRSIVAHGDF